MVPKCIGTVLVNNKNIAKSNVTKKALKKVAGLDHHYGDYLLQPLCNKKYK